MIRNPLLIISTKSVLNTIRNPILLISTKSRLSHYKESYALYIDKEQVKPL